jgi:glutaredoxin
MSFVQIYSLDGCPFSVKAENLLKEHTIKHKVIRVSQESKEKYKIENKMKTFPQIFIIEKKIKTKIGGADTLLDFINISHILKYNDISLIKLKRFFKIFKKK